MGALGCEPRLGGVLWHEERCGSLCNTGEYSSWAVLVRLMLFVFRFARPTFHRGGSRYFIFVHREHVSTRQIAMYKRAISHDACNRSGEFALACRIFLVDGFADVRAPFQGDTRLRIIFQVSFLPQQLSVDPLAESQPTIRK